MPEKTDPQLFVKHVKMSWIPLCWPRKLHLSVSDAAPFVILKHDTSRNNIRKTGQDAFSMRRGSRIIRVRQTDAIWRAFTFVGVAAFAVVARIFLIGGRDRFRLWQASRAFALANWFISTTL